MLLIAFALSGFLFFLSCYTDFYFLLVNMVHHCVNFCHLFRVRMCPFFSLLPFVPAPFTSCTFFPQVPFFSVFCLTFNPTVTFMTNGPMYLMAMHDSCTV